MGTLEPQSNGPLYSNTVIDTLAVDGWAVTFGKKNKKIGGCLSLSPYRRSLADKFLYVVLVLVNTYQWAKFQLSSSIGFVDIEGAPK